MAEHKQVETEDDDAASGRQRSKIAFPYDDLDSAFDVAQAIYSNVGTGNCEVGQLAAWMGQSSKSSGFRVQLAAARLFGVIESDDSNSYRVTPLGRQIVDPATARKAKATAFLNVPLFLALYNKYKDGLLAPTPALEREIAGLGVAEKQKERARQIFERSAEQAGFFEHGKTKLVLPAIKETESGKTEPPKKSGSGEIADPGLQLDPLIMALLRKIPKTEDGWPADKRLRWFKTFSMNVSEVYDGDNPVELKITLATQGDSDDNP